VQSGALTTRVVSQQCTVKSSSRERSAGCAKQVLKVCVFLRRPRFRVRRLFLTIKRFPLPTAGLSLAGPTVKVPHTIRSSFSRFFFPRPKPPGNPFKDTHRRRAWSRARTSRFPPFSPRSNEVESSHTSPRSRRFFPLVAVLRRFFHQRKAQSVCLGAECNFFFSASHPLLILFSRSKIKPVGR